MDRDKTVVTNAEGEEFTIQQIKSLAKKIKKEHTIPGFSIKHTEALDLASHQCGFHNWGHVINSKK